MCVCAHLSKIEWQQFEMCFGSILLDSVIYLFIYLIRSLARSHSHLMHNSYEFNMFDVIYYDCCGVNDGFAISKI